MLLKPKGFYFLLSLEISVVKYEENITTFIKKGSSKFLKSGKRGLRELWNLVTKTEGNILEACVFNLKT